MTIVMETPPLRPPPPPQAADTVSAVAAAVAADGLPRVPKSGPSAPKRSGLSSPALVRLFSPLLLVVVVVMLPLVLLLLVMLPGTFYYLRGRVW